MQTPHFLGKGIPATLAENLRWIRSLALLAPTCGNLPLLLNTLNTHIIFPCLTTLVLDMFCVPPTVPIARLLSPTLTELTIINLCTDQYDDLFGAMALSECKLRKLQLSTMHFLYPPPLASVIAVPPGIVEYAAQHCILSGELLERLLFEPNLTAVDITADLDGIPWPVPTEYLTDRVPFPSLTSLSVTVTGDEQLAFVQTVLQAPHIVTQLTELRVRMSVFIAALDPLLKLVNGLGALQHLELLHNYDEVVFEMPLELDTRVSLGALIARDTLHTLILRNLVPEHSFWPWLASVGRRLVNLSVMVDSVPLDDSWFRLVGIEFHELACIIDGLRHLNRLEVCFRTDFLRSEHVPELTRSFRRVSPLALYPHPSNMLHANEDMAALFLLNTFPEIIILPPTHHLAMCCRHLREI